SVCWFFFSSRRRHTRSKRDWSSDVCSSDLGRHRGPIVVDGHAIASSQESGDTYGYLRTYDPGAMYAPVTGYYSVVYGFTGIERKIGRASCRERGWLPGRGGDAESETHNAD